MKQRDLRDYVRLGLAIGITKISHKEMELLVIDGLKIVELTTGVYGRNGGLYEDISGNRYVIIGRTSNLFIL